MNLLFFTRRLTVGGCQVNAINLARVLVKRGHRVVLAAHPGPLEARLGPANIEFAPLEYENRKHPSLRTMRELSELCDRHQIDVLQAFDPIPLLEAYGSQFLHGRSVFGLIAAQETPEFRMPSSRETALVNPETRTRWVRDLGFSPECLPLITARLDCDGYSPRVVDVGELLGGGGVDASEPRVTLVTRIDAGKWSTIELFLDAARRWAELQPGAVRPQFVIVGGGPLLPKLRERVVAAGRGVFATGERMDIAQVMSASDVVLGMASTCQQGIACGRAVVVLGSQGVSEIIEPESFEFLADHHFNLHGPADRQQPAALCEQLAGLLADAERRARLGQFGRRVACERYDACIGAAQLEDVYDRLAAERELGSASRSRQGIELSLCFGSLYLHRVRRTLRRLRS